MKDESDERRVLLRYLYTIMMCEWNSYWCTIRRHI